MNYRNIFDSAINEAQAAAHLPDDETFIRIVKERTSRMKTNNIKWKKPAAVTAAVLAAASTAAVSVGAAMNWDIASFLMNKNAEIRELPEIWFRREFREYYTDAEFTDRSVSADSEYDILNSLSTEIDRDFDVNGYNIHIAGCVYDGNLLDVMYDVSEEEGVQTAETGVSFVLAVPDSCDDIWSDWEDVPEIGEDAEKHLAKFDMRIPDETDTVRLFIVDKADKTQVSETGMSYPSENYVDITLNRDNAYSYRSDAEISVGDFTITDLRITPFMIRAAGRSYEQLERFDETIIAVFSDGTVLDLYAGKSLCGEYQFITNYRSGGILLDAREITELRIGDIVIPINA